MVSNGTDERIATLMPWVSRRPRPGDPGRAQEAFKRHARWRLVTTPAASSTPAALRVRRPGQLAPGLDRREAYGWRAALLRQEVCARLHLSLQFRRRQARSPQLRRRRVTNRTKRFRSRVLGQVHTSCLAAPQTRRTHREASGAVAPAMPASHLGLGHRFDAAISGLVRVGTP